MNNFIYYAPTRIVFGRGTQNQVGSLIAGYGFRRTLLVYGGGSAERSGLLDQVRASLRESGVEFIELGGVKPNPDLGFIREGVRQCKAAGVDFILAVGGGSVIDTAKLTAVGAVVDHDPWLFSSKAKTPTAALPIGAILTMAASGSEMSASAVATNAEGALKRGYNSDFNRPLFAICNPELTYGLPPFQTACGIVDIFMHTAERYFSAGSDTPLTDCLAEGLMKTTLEAGTRAMAIPDDYEARATLMWAGSLSHNDLTGCGRDLFFPVHQMEHEISGLYPEVAHAAGLSALMPTWMRYVRGGDLPRFVQFAAEVMNCDVDYDHPERTADAGIDSLEALFLSIGMPINLRGLGIVDDSGFETMADKCVFFGARKLTAKVTLVKSDILKIFQLARG